MTKRFFFSAICAIVVCVATSCGGSQSKSPSSEETTAGKGLFAEVMTLVNEYQGKDDALSEKMQAAGQAQDMDKIEKFMKEQKALKPEFNEKLAAISTKLSGTSIAYELPDTFFYQMATEPAISEVTSNGLNATGVIQFSVSAKNDLKVGKYKGDDYRIYMKSVDESGTTLGYHVGRTIADDRKPLEIKAGEVLKPITVSIKLAEKSCDEASIAKIVFVPESEWQQSLKR